MKHKSILVIGISIVFVALIIGLSLFFVLRKSPGEKEVSSSQTQNTTSTKEPSSNSPSSNSGDVPQEVSDNEEDDTQDLISDYVIDSIIQDAQTGKYYDAYSASFNDQEAHQEYITILNEDIDNALVRASADLNIDDELISTFKNKTDEEMVFFHFYISIILSIVHPQPLDEFYADGEQQHNRIRDSLLQAFQNIQDEEATLVEIAKTQGEDEAHTHFYSIIESTSENLLPEDRVKMTEHPYAVFHMQHILSSWLNILRVAKGKAPVTEFSP